MTNLQEYLAGTDHLDATSNLRFIRITAGENVTLTFPTVAGKTYSVFFKDAVGETNWTKLADVPAALTNTVQSVPDPFGGSSTRFYRLTTPALAP
jgi:hypothetical protein